MPSAFHILNLIFVEQYENKMTIRPGISDIPRNKIYVPDQFCPRDIMIFFRLAESSLYWTFLVTSPT